MFISTFKTIIKKYFLSGHERTIRAKKHIVVSLLVRGLSLLTGFILISITIHYVNSYQYGIWITLGSIVGWFNFFDIGLGSGLKNKITEANAMGRSGDAKIFVSTTYAILSIISVFLFIVFFAVNSIVNWKPVLNITDKDININQIAIIIVAGFFLQFVIQIINIVLTACHEVSKVSFISFYGQLLSLFVIYILTITTTGSLLFLVIALTVAPILIQLIASFWYYKTKFKYLAPSFNAIQIRHAISLLTIGGTFFFIQIGGLILFQTDNIIIIKIFGSSEVTTYNIAYKLFSTIIMLFTVIMTPFWSAFTEAYTKGDYEWIKGTVRKMHKYWFILAGISLVLLSFSSLIYKLWLGNTVVTPPFSLSFAMLLYALGYCWLMIHCFLLNGIGKIKLQLYLYIISTIINIPLAIVFAQWFGLSGITYSNIFVFIYMGIVLYIQCEKIISNTAHGIWNR